MAMGHPIAFKANKHGFCASINVDITSNTSADMYQQMRLLLQTERHAKNQIHNGPRPTVSQRYADVLQLTIIGGAEAAGLKDFIGRITPGKRVDILLTNYHSTRLTPIHDPVAALVLFANASGVDSVFIDGRLVEDRGKLVRGQLAQVAYRIDGVSGKYHGVIKKGTKGGNCGTDCYNCCKIFR
jgi:cytosine/adenosine deaminase-related metal-dependent hydrolase